MISPKVIDSMENYICPITLDIMKNPVVAADGYSYEHSAILEWFRSGNEKSPMTLEKLENTTLIQNHHLRSII